MTRIRLINTDKMELVQNIFNIKLFTNDNKKIKSV